ncbi:MAG: class I SAM-dependent methyltransferase [Frankiaceae bacterium]
MSKRSPASAGHEGGFRMSSASQAYTETDVKQFFDQTLRTYLAFWDDGGVLHTGYFTGDDDEDYRSAAGRTSDVLIAEAGLDPSSYVLDVGCGCGNLLIDIAARIGCSGEGLDLSEERINFAREKLATESRERTLDVQFRVGSATGMPYADGTFSHVVSQDSLCLVPDKPRTHAEMHRVLRPGGVLALSDFLQQKEEISERARTHVFARVRSNGGYSLVGYQAALERAGFEIMLARNLTGHLRQNYRVLGKAARERAAGTPDAAARDWMLAFAESCGEIEIAIDDGEFGWGMLVARKPDGRRR